MSFRGQRWDALERNAEIAMKRVFIGLGLFIFLISTGFYAWGYRNGARSPCQDVEASDIFKLEKTPHDHDIFQ